jgi:Tol biopolymer transport system component
MNADGSGATALTPDSPSIDDESDLSPDGKKVVFFSGRDGPTSIYVMNSDGSELTRLTDGSKGDASPRWSPDGSRIAYSQSGSLAVMNADGSNIQTIMEAQPAQQAQPCRAGGFVGSWAPDGERIVYYSAALLPADQGGSRFWICSIRADGSDMQVLVEEPAKKLHAEPYWSPDGKKIAFRDDRDGDCATPAGCNYDVFVLDLETGEQTNVTKHPKFDIEPAWSPDGEWIVFASNRDDPNFDLYVVRPDGSDLQRVLNDPDSKDSYPSWR